MSSLSDSDHNKAFQIGAGLIAILGFPGPKEIKGRRQAFEGLCAQWIHATCVADPANKDLWHARYRVYAAIDEKETLFAV
ncbi:MAG TPA: hypothetical protein VLX09_19780 [Stellaceae bacterium]|nr:hypothetical protein [Stellaceae bacterium]